MRNSAHAAIEQKPVSKKDNLLFYCDNLEAMNFLIDNGFENKIDLVYIDPPFLSGEKYYHRKDNTHSPAFDDVWKADDDGSKVNSYLDMLRPRLEAISRLLSPAGSVFVHLDWHAVHHVKVMMDSVFGLENFRNEIIVKRGRRKNLQYQFNKVDRMHNSYDSVLWYSKSPSAKFSLPLAKQDIPAKWMGFWSNVNRPTMRYEIFGYTPERGQWKWEKKRALRAIANYRKYERKFSSISLEEYWKNNGMDMEFIRKRDGVKYAEYWIPPKTHRLLDNVWLDIEAYSYSTGYGTEKHPELLERVIGQFSKGGDIVADFFCGSGTTLRVAQDLGRRWIGCDSSAVAISVAGKRLGRQLRLIRQENIH